MLYLTVLMAQSLKVRQTSKKYLLHASVVDEASVGAGSCND